MAIDNIALASPCRIPKYIYQAETVQSPEFILLLT